MSFFNKNQQTFAKKQEIAKKINIDFQAVITLSNDCFSQMFFLI